MVERAPAVPPRGHSAGPGRFCHLSRRHLPAGAAPGGDDLRTRYGELGHDRLFATETLLVEEGEGPATPLGGQPFDGVQVFCSGTGDPGDDGVVTTTPSVQPAQNGVGKGLLLFVTCLLVTGLPVTGRLGAVGIGALGYGVVGLGRELETV